MSHIPTPSIEFNLFGRIDGELHGGRGRLQAQEEGEGDFGQHVGNLRWLVELHVRSEGTNTKPPAHKL